MEEFDPFSVEINQNKVTSAALDDEDHQQNSKQQSECSFWRRNSFIAEKQHFRNPNVPFLNHPKSWYHGRLTRELAEDRLRKVNKIGAFLIRESDKLPKTYALSFMKNSDDIQHYRITKICGDYFIDELIFDSLTSLVEHFAVNSEICPNFYLTTPVQPTTVAEISQRKVLAVVSFRGMKDSDELSFLKGDIFTVFEDFGGNWLYVRSERTLETGLVYDGLVADLNSENVAPKDLPYFYANITTQEAKRMLNKAGRGSYLVKPSDSCPPNLTLLLNTGKAIERVIIKALEKKGHYEVGSREFTSLHDIIERYSETEISDGLTLQKPLYKSDEIPESNSTLDAELYKRLQLNRSTYEYNKHGDNVTKCGHLYKKAKSDSKWRYMYFVLKELDGQLFCYDNLKQTKPKLVLDLCHCSFYVVHYSLFNRCYCFQIILRSLNKDVVYYFYAEKENDYESWCAGLKQLCAGQRRRYSSPILYYRNTADQYRTVRKAYHLHFRIYEARIYNLKSSADIFAVLSINDAKVFRTNYVSLTTTSSNNNNENVIFDEDVYLENIGTEVAHVSVNFFGRSKRLLRSSELGCAKIDICEKFNSETCTPLNDWVKLKSTDRNESESGQCRICVHYTRQYIMPVEEYSSLFEILRSDDFHLCRLLIDWSCDEDRHRLAIAFLNVFSVDNLYLSFIINILGREIEETNETAALFRKTSFATILMYEFLNLYATDYIKSTLKTAVTKIIDCKLALEIDSRKTDNKNNANASSSSCYDLNSNATHLVEYAKDVCRSITNSLPYFPKHIQHVLCALKQVVVKKWSNDPQTPLRAVSSFVFLRLICLALLHPRRYGFLNETISDCSQRNLLLVAKIIQKAANVKEKKINTCSSNASTPDEEVDSDSIENISNSFIEIRQHIVKYIDSISSPCTLSSTLSSPPPAKNCDVAPHFATIFSYCEKHIQKMPSDSINGSSAFTPVIELLRNHLNSYLNIRDSY